MNSMAWSVNWRCRSTVSTGAGSDMSVASYPCRGAWSDRRDHGVHALAVVAGEVAYEDVAAFGQVDRDGLRLARPHVLGLRVEVDDARAFLVDPVARRGHRQPGLGER